MANPNKAKFEAAATKLKANYNIAYVQHAPMEPRAAVAEWKDGSVTVWTATQNPFRVRGEIADAFHISAEQGPRDRPGFRRRVRRQAHGRMRRRSRAHRAGGAETGRPALDARRRVHLGLLPPRRRDRDRGRPRRGRQADVVALRQHQLRPLGIETPYRVAGKLANETYIQSDPPLRHGSYRALAATANTFGRECFMDELAAAIKKDPLEFRLAHLDAGRLQDVLMEAAKKFDWREALAGQARRERRHRPGVRHRKGLVRRRVRGSRSRPRERRTENPPPLPGVRVRQDHHPREPPPAGARRHRPGARPGAARGERVRRRQDHQRVVLEVPRPALRGRPAAIDIHLLDRPDLPSVGAGETPLIAVAPAIANAVFDACGVRLRDLPLKLPATA